MLTFIVGEYMSFNVCVWLYNIRDRLPYGSKAWNKINDAIQTLRNSEAKDSNIFDCYGGG